MSLLVLALLIGLWSAILLPSAIRSYRDSSPASSVQSFQRAMAKLQTRVLPGREEITGTAAASAAPGGVSAPATSARERALGRRRTVLGILSAVLVASAVGMVAVDAAFGWVLALDASALVAYLVMLWVLRTRAEEARRKVATLPRRPPAGEPQQDALDVPQAASDSG